MRLKMNFKNFIFVDSAHISTGKGLMIEFVYLI